MSFSKFRFTAVLGAALLCLSVGRASAVAQPQSSSNNSQQGSSSSNPTQQEKAPSLVDPAGPTISLVSSQPVFLMASALNSCGYDEGLDESSPVRTRVREEINKSLARSEDARKARDKMCLFIAQHRMTGTSRDVGQYISLALYLTDPPELE